MGTTLHLTAKLKAGVTSGMRISGTLVAVNAAGITFPQYYGSPPQSSGGATITGVFAATEAADTFSASGTNGFSPLQAGHLSTLIDAPASYISIVDHGAVSSATSTAVAAANHTAIYAALSAGKAAGLPVFVPTGDWSYNNTISISAVAVVGQGPTSILRAINHASRSLWLKGSSASLKNVALFTNGTTTRQNPWEYWGIVIYGAINFTVENVYVKNPAGAGIGTHASAGPGLIQNCTVSGSMSDSIHMTNNAHHINVILNHTINSGDDGIACVSYSQDGGKCNNLMARHNWLQTSINGRNMSVVGGQDINYHHNLLDGNEAAAGFYVAQETSFTTLGCNSVSFTYNTIINCGNPAIGHAAMMIYSDGTYPNGNITVERNDIQCTGTENGIRYFGPQTSVALTSNKITDAATDYVGGVTAGVTITLYTSGNVGYEYSTP